MTARKAILALSVFVFLAGLAAADVDPRDILPTTDEFQQAFGSDWKHPWDYPTDYPIYKTQEDMEDEFEDALETVTSTGMAEVFEDLDMEALGIDIEEFLGDATGGQSISEMMSKSAEVMENSAYAIDEYVVTYGELEQSGWEYTLDRLEAKLQVQIMDEDYVRSHPEVIDTDIDTMVEVPDISGPGFDMDVIEKGFGDVSSCVRTISEGKVSSEVCALKVCNLQFSIELIRSTEDYVWDHDQIDALLEIIEARMQERVSEDLCTVTVPEDIEIAETEEPTTSIVREPTTSIVQEPTTTPEPVKGPGLLDQLMKVIGDIIGAIKSAVGGGPGDEIVCNSPYMRFGKECCLDRDGNSICDRDEATTSVATTSSVATTMPAETTAPTTSIATTVPAETTAPTTSLATTTTLPIACTLSSDCGEWKQVPVCHNGDVYIQVTTPICRNAGTPEAQCIEQVKFAGASIYSEPRMEEECNDGCQDGECL